MEINVAEKGLERDPATKILVDQLKANSSALGLTDAIIYYEFPIFKDDEGELITSRVFIVSPQHGIIAFGTSSSTRGTDGNLRTVDADLDQAFNAVYSRLLRNRHLRKGKRELSFPTEAAIFAPFLTTRSGDDFEPDARLILSESELYDFLTESKTDEISKDIFLEIVATVEGAKGLVRPAKREVDESSPHSKGSQVARLEAEIASFDQRQKRAFFTPVVGAQRIRGLAGSGKTVVLAMKAALAHLRAPDARILYTFYTKSLHQHIKRLITRFYRQYNDQDPDWSKLRVMHAWGGRNYPGTYFDACEAFSVRPVNYAEASRARPGQEFAYACDSLLNTGLVKPLYDYTFIDEGQDFPSSFLRLCRALTVEDRFVWAYDELQTIFSAQVPSTVEIFGKEPDGSPSLELTEDTVLYKCYRNPREILVCAHAMGFGIYGPKIVQMLENKEHWEDIGYKVISGDFQEGSKTEIERPTENSLQSISAASSINEIVHAESFDHFVDEIDFVANSIESDIRDGLRPDDILVVTVDDRNAKAYFEHIDRALASKGIRTNNIHADKFNVVDFSMEDHVTLSTVYKAKGNEAFVVYVVGVDAVFATPDVRARNMLFTAMTRAKAWVHVSGVGELAERLQKEIVQAKESFPYLRFKFPSREQLKIMKRDLEIDSTRRRELERVFEMLESQLSDEEIEEMARNRALNRNKTKFLTEDKPTTGKKGQ